MTARIPTAAAIVLVSTFLSVVPEPVLAKGPPTQVTMDGPGFVAPIAITDPDILEALSPGIINNPNVRASPRAGDDAPPYKLVRSWGSAYSDRLHYYPGADGRSQILVLNPPKGTEATPAWWFVPSDRADKVLRQVVADPNSAAAPPKTARRNDPHFEVALLVGAALLGAIVLLRRRAASRSSLGQDEATLRPV